MFLIGWKSPILMSYWLIKHQQLTPSGLELYVMIKKSWQTVFCWHKHHETGTVIAGSGPPGPVTTDTMCLEHDQCPVMPSDQSAEQSWVGIMSPCHNNIVHLETQELLRRIDPLPCLISISMPLILISTPNTDSDHHHSSNLLISFHFLDLLTVLEQVWFSRLWFKCFW